MTVTRIVVLIALQEEFEIFCKIFPDVSDCSSAFQVRLRHRTHSDSIELISVLAEQMGSQSAMLSTERAIQDFKPHIIVILGIAGSLIGDAIIGDVVVSNSIADIIHNNKITDVKSSTKINFSPNFYNVDAELVASFTFLNVHPHFSETLRDWRAKSLADVQAAGLENQIDREPRMHIALVVSGPVSASSNFNALLKQIDRKAGAIETESGGAFATATRAGIPTVAIRGISDLADRGKGKLERDTKGSVRQLAMQNASRLLEIQLKNDGFISVGRRQAAIGHSASTQLEVKSVTPGDIVRELEREIRARLKEFSLDIQSQPEGSYLPIPRARRVELIDELSTHKISDPEEIIECLRNNNRIVMRVPRSFPSNSLPWSIAYYLIRQSIGGRTVLPIVVGSNSIVPPKKGLEAVTESTIHTKHCPDEFTKVYIIEEPKYESRSRLRFLIDQINNCNDKVLILTKYDDRFVEVASFVSEIGATEYDLAPVSLTETIFFLQKTFDMQLAEAEAVATKLDDTFRKFRLDAHPTYFAGIQEDTLAALITANRRAELIQLAVDGLLSLIVAADRSYPNLSRTARERFLKKLALEKATSGKPLTDSILTNIAQTFLEENFFELSATEFLAPFFDSGLFYRITGCISFTHPYLESYLLAQALREDSVIAKRYFSPDVSIFDYYAYDLYCELGPARVVVETVLAYSRAALEGAMRAYKLDHVFFEGKSELLALSKPVKLASLSKGLIDRAKTLKSESEAVAVREEKQRLLDAQRHVRRQVTNKEPDRIKPANDEIKAEFAVLDALSRSYALCANTIAAGSESVDGDVKAELAQLCISLGEKFSDVWTRNRMRINFSELRNAILTDENIWKIIEENKLDKSTFEDIKSDLEIFVFGYEISTIFEPMSRVLWKLTSNAGISVLKPVVQSTVPRNSIEKILKAAWLIDIDQQDGKIALKNALANYEGSDVFRIIIANHLLWRVFWHHYRTAGADHFVSSAKRALATLGLSPSSERLEQVQKGVRNLE